MRIFFHIVIITLLTILTQIGGIVYLISVLLTKKAIRYKSWKRSGTFIGLYLLATFLIVPFLAPIFGREQIKESEHLEAHAFVYKLSNRNYVRPKLNQSLNQIANEFAQKHRGIKLIYLDASFPFIDKFPLLPHLSHNDGKKVDVSLIYEDENFQLTNKKPSRSGYGVYESPTGNEFNQTVFCRTRGYWQYDFPKYLTLGEINRDLEFSEKGNRDLVKIIVKQAEIGKLFIEPHLKSRLHLSSGKIRFHGCKAVRHDDHIHFQLN